MRRYRLWQVAWLWVDKEPATAIPVGTDAHVVLQMLFDSVRDGELSIADEDKRAYVTSEIPVSKDSEVARDDLCLYAMNVTDE